MKITGTILDVTDNTPLGGASILVVMPDGSYSRTGTQSFPDGTFSIESTELDLVGAKLEFSFVGYETVRLTPPYAKGNVFLNRKGDSLGEVVVTAKMNTKRPVMAAFIVSSLIITIMIVLFAKLFKSSIIKN